MTYGVKSPISTSQPLSLTPLGMAIEEFIGAELPVPVKRKGFTMSSDKIELKVLLLAIFSMA